MRTEFIHINGNKTYYTINENAEIYNTKTGQKLHAWLEKRGYLAVSISVNNLIGTEGFVRRTVHRIMAETFLPNPENKRTVNHKDGNKLNNQLSNLEWATHKENYDHARALGLYKTGDKLSYATVKNETVHEICRLIEKGLRNVDIIRQIGLPNDNYGKTLVGRIRTGKSWKDISASYDFIKTGSLKKIPDEVIHKVCECIVKGKTTGEIFRELYLPDNINYQRLKDLVRNVRNGKYHRGISSLYGITSQEHESSTTIPRIVNDQQK